MSKIMESKSNGKIGTREVTQRIRQLYQQLVASYRLSLNNAIEIGRLLLQQKGELGHGRWTPWVKQNLPFCLRSARNYIGLYNHREELKRASVADLNDAYKVLANYKNHDRDQKRTRTKKFRKAFADKSSKFVNPDSGDYINKLIAGDNFLVMNEMLRHGMEGKYTAIVTSPGYNADFYYGKDYDDNKPYAEYLQDILKRFSLYSKLLRIGGRVIYNIGNFVKNKQNKEGGDYNHQIVTDLEVGVRKVAPDLKFFNHIIWDKGVKGKVPLNKNYGTFASPKTPVTRICHENILIWSNQQFELENIEGTEPDITPEEFTEWSWSVWKISPYVRPGNPHECSFPPKLIERLLKFYTYPNDLICDPYAGVSVTAQVCKKFNRRHTTIDLNPNYVEYASELLKSA